MKILNEAALTQKPDVVVFDLDNTLYPYTEPHLAATEAARQRACAALGIGSAIFDEAFNKARSQVKEKLGPTASSHSRLLYFQRAIEILGMKTRISLSLDLEQTYWRTFMLAAQLRPSVVDFLMDARAVGATTAILTDLTTQIQLRKIVFFGLESLLDYVVTSEEAGVDKEGGRPFEVLKAKLELSPGAKIWMIGDDACDLRAREALGATTFLINQEGRDLSQHADITFNNFSELRDIIGRWLTAQ